MKDSKSTHAALYTESTPSASSSTLTINELDPSNFKDFLDNDLSKFDDSLALFTNTFNGFPRKSNFRRNKPLTITNKPWKTPVDKASMMCYNY